MMRSDHSAHPESTRRRFLLQAGASAVAASMGTTAGLAPRRTVAAETSSYTRKRKVPLRLGLASYTLRKLDLDETLAATRRLGLELLCFKSFHLPLNATPKKIAETKAKVEQAGLTLYGGGVIGMSKEEQVDSAFEYAKAAGMTTIVGVPAPNMLPLVDKKVRQYDIEVAIHNHGPGDKTYPTPESIYKRIKDLDRRIGICMDIGHTLRIGADPYADVERYAERLLDVHIKDVSAPTPQGKPVEVGRGVIDIPRFLKELLKINYTRVVSFEYEKDANDPVPGLAESVGYVKGVLAAI